MSHEETQNSSKLKIRLRPKVKFQRAERVPSLTPSFFIGPFLGSLLTPPAVLMSIRYIRVSLVPRLKLKTRTKSHEKV